MAKKSYQLNQVAVAVAMALSVGATTTAIAGPGIAPVYSAVAAPPPALPDTFANTYYANSPQGPRPDLVGCTYANYIDPTTGQIVAGCPTIDTGTALRKFVDILPSVPGLAPTTNAGTGVTGASTKYIPLAVAGTWPSDGADYYHIAVVEYHEQMHSDLPKATTLRGYVQIEEPGQATPAGSKHIALSYPDGNPITLPDASGTQQQVYAYDNPHYMGPVIAAVKDKAVRIKYSNLLPTGDANGVGLAPGRGGAPGRNGDLFIPVDPTLPGGVFPENRVDIHLHGGLTPWISDGTPHQWTIPVGDTRHGFLNDIAVTAVGAGYSASPTITIDPPQSVVRQLTTTVANGGISGIIVGNGAPNELPNQGAGYTVATAAPVIPAPVASVQAAGTASIGGGQVTSIAVANAGMNYLTPPSVTVAPPGTIAAQTGTAVLGTGANAGKVTSVTITAPIVNGYSTAPSVTFSAPASTAATFGTLTATVTGTTGSVAGTLPVTNGGAGYVTAPSVTVSAPAPAAAASVTLATAPTVNATTGALTGGSFTVSTAGWGYGSASPAQKTLTLAPPASTTATVTGTQVGAPKTTTGAATNWTSTGTKVVTVGTGAGYGFGATPTVTLTGGNGGTYTVTAFTVSATGAVTSVTINVSRGFNRAPTGMTIGAPNGLSSATANLTVVNNVVTGVSAITGGSGYRTAPTVGTVFTAATPPASVTATGTATVNGAYVLTGVTIAGGTNYAATPTVTVGGPTAVTATGTALVANGSVAAAYTGNGINWGRTGTYNVLPTTAGSGYAPGTLALTVTGGRGGVATATATVNAAGAVTGITVQVTTAYGRNPTLGIPAPAANYHVTGVTINNAGSGYTAAPTVSFSANAIQAVATANVANGKITGFTIVNGGTGYTTVPSVSIGAPAPATPAVATAVVGTAGNIIGFNVTNPGVGYWTAPSVTLTGTAANPGWPAGAVQATATATVSAGALTGVNIVNAGAGYLTTPTVTLTDPTGTGGAISALMQPAVGQSFHQVPDMTGNTTVTAGGATATYTAPITGEGTLYYTNNQNERLMFYHDHASAITRLNVYAGMAAGYLVIDPKVEPALPIPNTAATGAGALQGYIPEEQIPLVIQERTFVPKDIAQQDQNWDPAHWGVYGDLWFPHVYETNQNPSFLRSLSNLGRWDWGPWFAIVYPALYALPSGKYGDVTTTPEAYQDTPIVNGTAYPTLTVEPRAYRLRILNAANDRFMSLGFYVADTTQPAAFADSLHAAGQNFTEVAQFSPTGPQPTVVQTNPVVGNALPNVFTTGVPGTGMTAAAASALLPWPMDGGAAGPGATHIVPTPTTMGPPMVTIGNEAGILPQWVQHDPVPLSFDYNRRSATVLNTSQNNDPTQQCFPECHGLYIGPAERSDVVVDFAPYAGMTLILYNDAPAPNPGYDTRIDYFTGNDPTDMLNYMTGGAHNTMPGYGPNTRTIMQVVVGTAQNASGANPIDYTKATVTGANGLAWWNPNALGAGRVLGTLTSSSPGVIQQVYSATQGAPIVGESAYNIAFNATTAAANAANGLTTSQGGYVDNYGNMYLGSQNQPEFYVTQPAAAGTTLTITGIALTGQTSATGAASGVGLGSGSSGTNTNAGGGTGYTVPPAVVISPPTNCTLPGTQSAPCAVATATAAVSGGQVTSVTLTSAGAGYTEVPSVLFVSGGQVTAISVTNAGSGYASAPSVTISAPDTCSLTAVPAPSPTVCAQATATAAISAAGSISGITITSGGQGYSKAPTITIGAPAALGGGATLGAVTLSGTGVSSIAVATGGSGYVTAPSVTIAAPPANTTAAGTATLTGGAVSSVAMTSAGSGYTSVPSVTFSAAPAGGTVAVATPVVLDVAGLYYYTGLNFSSVGSGYTPGPVTVSVANAGATCLANFTVTVTAAGTFDTTSVVPNDIGVGESCTAGGTASIAATPAAAGTTAVGTAVMDATGSTVVSVAITTPGSGYASAPSVTFAAPPVNQKAVASAVVSGGVVTAVNVTTPGTGYTSAPSVSLTGGTGGTQATALAAASGGGYGAQAAAITSNTKLFIAPAAIPGNFVPPTPNATPVTLTPTVANMLGCNAAQTSCTNLAGAVVGRLQNPAIQELFEPFYGRMNATLGVEMPNQSLQVQTTLPLNYVDPGTEFWEYNQPVMWKVTHNGVDAHPVHFHLLNLQLVNRVGWDGTIKAPEDDEIGWKEVIKMNPLEDIILAMQPIQPQVPFGLERSIRYDDPSQPLGVNLGLTQYTTNGISGALGPMLANQGAGAAVGVPGATTPGTLGNYPNGDTQINNPNRTSASWEAQGNLVSSPAYISAAGIAAGVGGPATITNSVENYDNEYVWHCHILGHEENDFMRPISVLSSPSAPAAPANVVATQGGVAGALVTVSWTDTTPIAAYGTAGNTTFGNQANELGYLVQRSTDGTHWTTVALVPANTTSAVDPLATLPGTSYTYRVAAYNAAGLTAASGSITAK